MGGTKIQKKIKIGRYVRLGGGWGGKQFKPKKMGLKLSM
jgi:hypothetical protein